MIKKALLVSFSIIFMQQVWSFPCYFTVVKDNCWTEYEVSVDIFDAGKDQKLLNVIIPAGKSWTRGEIDCEAKQNFMYKASFSPAFWKNDEGKVYRSLRNWTLPEKINVGDKAWGLPICYPADFSSVPLPPKAGSSCKCDFLAVPQIKLD